MDIFFITVTFVFLGLVLIFSIAGLVYSIVEMCGYQAPKTAETMGWLKSSKYQRNVRINRTDYKHYMEYSYEYCVNGKMYEYNSYGHGKPRDFPQKITMVYQKKHPDWAHIKGKIPNCVAGIIASAVLTLFWLTIIICVINEIIK